MTSSRQATIDKQAVKEANYQQSLMLNAFNATQTLLTDQQFIVIMRQIFEITNYDLDTTQHEYTPEQLLTHQGKRDVWLKIRSTLIGTNFEALAKIEHHKDMNRRKG